jgi:cytochrome o ubiquinol oxidase subunit 1
MPTFTEQAYGPWVTIAGFGALVILAALTMLFVTGWVSLRNREKLSVPLGDPWDGRTLEWTIPAPAPAWNFATIPTVEDRDDFAARKLAGRAYPAPDRYEDIEMPRSTYLGLILCFATIVLGFAIVWHVWWLAALSFAVVPLSMIYRAFLPDSAVEVTIPAARIAEQDMDWRANLARTRAISRDEEDSPANRGLAAPEGAPA